MRVIILSLLLSGCSGWNKESLFLEATYLSLWAVDYNQTLHLKNNRMIESNPILGETPSKKRVINYFVLTGLCHLTITYKLKDKKRWLYFTNGLEANMVYMNHRNGL